MAVHPICAFSLIGLAISAMWADLLGDEEIAGPGGKD
jgi:hypothetical protein